MSRRPIAGLATAAGLALLLGSCTGQGDSLPRPSRAYCETAWRYEQKIERAPQPSIDEQIRMLSKMAANAPHDIAPDVAVFLEAMRRVRTDPSVKDRPKVVTAVENVLRRTSHGCGFFEQGPRTGF